MSPLPVKVTKLKRLLGDYMAFDEGMIFFVQQLLWHGASDFVILIFKDHSI